MSRGMAVIVPDVEEKESSCCNTPFVVWMNDVFLGTLHYPPVLLIDF